MSLNISTIKTPRLFGVEYDYNGDERALYTTSGAFRNIYEEVVASPKPVLSNFHIDDGDELKVHFDSSSDVNGITTVGFVISGKKILSITRVDAISGYFTVDSAFTWWDNNTIRLGENEDTSHSQTLLYNFTLTHITNNIVEPTTSTNYFVNSTAIGGGDGLADITAWTLQEAIDEVEAGAITDCKIKMLNGDYGSTEYTITDVIALVDAPVIFEGYNVIAPITDSCASLFTDYDADVAGVIDTAVYPVLNGIHDSKSIALKITSCSFIIFRNIQIIDFATGIWMRTTGTQPYCEGLVYDNVVLKDFRYYDSWEGTAILASSAQTGSNNINLRIINGLAIDIASFGLYSEGLRGIIKDSKVFCGNEFGVAKNALDYYYNVPNGTDCQFIGNEAHRLHDVQHNGHGVGCKAEPTYGGGIVSRLLVADNKTYDIRGEAYYLAYKGCSNCVVKDNYSYDSLHITYGHPYLGNFLVARDSAYNNTFERNHSVGMGITISSGMTVEQVDIEEIEYASLNNIFRNNIADNPFGVLTIYQATNYDDVDPEYHPYWSRLDTYKMENLQIYHNTFHDIYQEVFYNKVNSYPRDEHLEIISIYFENNIIDTADGTFYNGYQIDNLTQKHTTYNKIKCFDYALPDGVGNCEQNMGLDDNFIPQVGSWCFRYKKIVDGDVVPKFSDNLLLNSDFSAHTGDNFDTWIEYGDNVTHEIISPFSNVCRLEKVVGTTAVYQPVAELAAGTYFLVSFWAKADIPLQEIAIQLGGDIVRYDITDSWAEYSFIQPASSTGSCFFITYGTGIKVDLAEVSLKEKLV